MNRPAGGSDDHAAADASWHASDALWESLLRLKFGPERLAVADREIDAILALVGVVPGSDVLDLPCGVGRHALELARRGYSVTAVDRTVAYLDEARRRAAEEDLEVELVAADMREFERPGAFDLALNLWSSFGYFEDPEDDHRVLRNYARSLRPRGHLLLEALCCDGGAALEGGTSQSYEGGVAHERRWIQGDRLHTRVTLEEAGTTRELVHTVRLYAPDTLVAAMERAGLRRVSTFGGLDGRAHQPGDPKILLLAEKP